MGMVLGTIDVERAPRTLLEHKDGYGASLCELVSLSLMRQLST